jgi:hypothetical protein
VHLSMWREANVFPYCWRRGVSASLGLNESTLTQTAIWICLDIAVGKVVGTVTLLVLGGERQQASDLKTWTDDGGLAWDSTPLARLCDKKGDREIA